MPDKKFKEILEYKSKTGCELCDIQKGNWCNTCNYKLMADALDLINRLQAENERLKNAYKQCAWERDTFQEELKDINAENIEELIHKLECLLCHATGGKLSKHTYPLDTMERCVNDTIQEYCEEAETEAYKKFDELLKEDCLSYPLEKDDITMLVDVESYNNLLKELVGEDNV